MASSCLNKHTPVDRNRYVGSTGLGPERNTIDRVRRTIGAAASKKETPVPTDLWSLLRCCLAEKHTKTIAQSVLRLPSRVDRGMVLCVRSNRRTLQGWP